MARIVLSDVFFVFIFLAYVEPKLFFTLAWGNSPVQPLPMTTATVATTTVTVAAAVAAVAATMIAKVSGTDNNQFKVVAEETAVAVAARAIAMATAMATATATAMAMATATATVIVMVTAAGDDDGCSGDGGSMMTGLWPSLLPSQLLLA